jgi:hypothetical protein
MGCILQDGGKHMLAIDLEAIHEVAEQLVAAAVRRVELAVGAEEGTTPLAASATH